MEHMKNLQKLEGEEDIQLELKDFGLDNLNYYSKDKVEEQYKHVSYLLKIFQLNINKCLSTISAYNWNKIVEYIKKNEEEMIKQCERNDLIFNENMFKNSNPNINLSNQVFHSTLQSFIETGEQEVRTKEEIVPNIKKENEEDNSLESYTKFIMNQSELDYFQ